MESGEGNLRGVTNHLQPSKKVNTEGEKGYTFIANAQSLPTQLHLDVKDYNYCLWII